MLRIFHKSMPRDYIKVFLNGTLKWNHLIFHTRIDVIRYFLKKYCYLSRLSKN